MTFIPLILYLPSGNREATIEHLVIGFIFYLVLENNGRAKFFIIQSFIVLVAFLLVFMYAYRDGGVTSSGSVVSQYSEVSSAEYTQENASPLTGLVERLSEYVALGRVIDHVPSRWPYDGLKAMDTWWQVALPGFLRPKKNTINFNEPAQFSEDIGISPGWWSSAPLMLMGDFFRRFGWLGLTFGMFIVGSSLRMLDDSFKSHSPFFKIFFYTIMAKTIWRLYSGSLLGFFVGFTRDLVVAYLIASLLTFLLKNLKMPSRRWIS
jgi:hypothetical protein